MPKVIFLCTELKKSAGGIANYNRNFLNALKSNPSINSIKVFSYKDFTDEIIFNDTDKINVSNYNTKIDFILNVLKIRPSDNDIVICGHVNLFLVALLIKFKLNCSCFLIGHGIEIWDYFSNSLNKILTHFIEELILVSFHTKRQVNKNLSNCALKIRIIPNAVDLQKFKAKNKKKLSFNSVSLTNKTVITFLGRLEK